jgi:hypothetical protein
MKERPIIFTGEMVRGIIEERKTMTRRAIKPQPIYEGEHSYGDSWAWKKGIDWFSGVTTLQLTSKAGLLHEDRNPYGQPGDRLWVRETWGIGTRSDPFQGWRDGIEYRVDEVYLDDIDDLPLYPIPEGVEYEQYETNGWRPPIHMPRWASRILLEVTSVRVEHIQDITLDEIRSEGILDARPSTVRFGDTPTLQTQFANLWDSINAKHGCGWGVNPWVWVVGFMKVAA